MPDGFVHKKKPGGPRGQPGNSIHWYVWRNSSSAKRVYFFSLRKRFLAM
jgi:hypothetical protein